MLGARQVEPAVLVEVADPREDVDDGAQAFVAAQRSRPSGPGSLPYITDMKSAQCGPRRTASTSRASSMACSAIPVRHQPRVDQQVVALQVRERAPAAASRPARRDPVRRGSAAACRRVAACASRRPSRAGAGRGCRAPSPRDRRAPDHGAERASESGPRLTRSPQNQSGSLAGGRDQRRAVAAVVGGNPAGRRMRSSRARLQAVGR